MKHYTSQTLICSVNILSTTEPKVSLLHPQQLVTAHVLSSHSYRITIKEQMIMLPLLPTKNQMNLVQTLLFYLINSNFSFILYGTNYTENERLIS